MKSAFELAMERLERDQGPSRKLSEEQRERIADIDRRCDARVAETRLSFSARLATATPDLQAAIRQELADSIQAIEDQRAKEKESVWNAESE